MVTKTEKNSPFSGQFPWELTLYSDVFEYVNMFYNCNRGHSYLAYKAPIEFASVNKARMAA